MLWLPRQGRGPCDLIDWITPKAKAPAFDIGPLMSFWPDRLENVEIARVHRGRADNADPRDSLMRRIMIDDCTLIDWRMLDTVHPPLSGAMVAATGDRPLRQIRTRSNSDTSLPARTGMRIAVRTEIDGPSCREAARDALPPQAKGVLVATELDPAQSRWRLFDGLDRWFGRASRVDINTFIYRNAVISPKHAFASANTRRYLVRDGSEVLLMSFYVETTNRAGLDPRGLMIVEMLNVTGLAKRLRLEQSVCRATIRSDSPGIDL